MGGGEACDGNEAGGGEGEKADDGIDEVEFHGGSAFAGEPPVEGGAEQGGFTVAGGNPRLEFGALQAVAGGEGSQGA